MQAQEVKTHRINVTLTLDEAAGLLRLSKAERRDPRAQAALIIRRALMRRKLLTAAPPPLKLPDLPARLQPFEPEEGQSEK
jgi:hypothetical protein